MLPHIPDEGREREIPRIEQIHAEKVADLIRGIPEVVERRFRHPVHMFGDTP
jgi:phage terminase Nu1 subunit (DNA packaging protein)